MQNKLRWKPRSCDGLICDEINCRHGFRFCRVTKSGINPNTPNPGCRPMTQIHPVAIRLLRFLSAVLALVAIASIAVAAEPDEHQHAATGPKGGVIVELGEEELHAELLHDDEVGIVTI